MKETRTNVEKSFTDRERILINIAALLAGEVSHLQGLPEVQRYMSNPHSLSRIRCDWDVMGRTKYEKGDLVVCATSRGRQQNPWLVSFVEGPHGKGDTSGLQLRAIGSQDTCDYGNESFIRITGIQDRLLWEGDKHKFARKLASAFAKIDSYTHRFRGLQFRADGTAAVFVGQVFGGLSNKTKPYEMQITFNARTSVKNIVAQMEKQGFDKREFEQDDGTYSGPMEGLASFKREDVVGALDAQGIKLKPEFK